jgi:hypothetical protein
LGMTASVRWLVTAAITAVGVVLVAVGAALDGDSYTASVLANLGTTVLLAIPLLLVERMLERRVAAAQRDTDKTLGRLGDRIDEVQQSVTEVGERLAEVARRTERRVDERRARDETDLVAPARAIADDPSFTSVMNAWTAAERVKAISTQRRIGGEWTTLMIYFGDRGFTVRIGHQTTGRYSHLTADALVLSVTTEDQSRPSVGVRWVPDMVVEDLFEQWDVRLRQEWGGAAPRVPSDLLLARLAAALELALRTKADRGATGGWALIGVVTDDWIVTTHGLEHAMAGLIVPAADLRADDAEPPAVPADLPQSDRFADVWSAARRLERCR